jgi:SWI/SNF-related matrix-associated actin-dependent regulator of chromatin subfamily A member 5
VIAPKSTIGNWMKEFKKWTPSLRVVNLVPTQEMRYQILSEQMKAGTFDVCVTTYNALNIIPELKKFKWYLITFDEAHKLKNSDSKTAQISRQLPSVRRLLMTGTPLMNNVVELWSLLNFLMPQLFSSMDDFSSWFNLDENQNNASKDLSQDQKLKVVQVLHRIMRPFMLRRTKKDLENKLPDKIEINVSIELSQMQLKIYQELLKARNITAIDGSKKILHVLLMQLRKVCNHPYMFDDLEDENAEEFGEHLVTNSGKMVFLDKLLSKLKGTGEKCILFSCFTTMLDILEDYCNMRGH